MIFTKYIKIFEAKALVYLIVNPEKNFIRAEKELKKRSFQELKK
jgi:hypothetical protein